MLRAQCLGFSGSGSRCGVVGVYRLEDSICIIGLVLFLVCRAGAKLKRRLEARLHISCCVHAVCMVECVFVVFRVVAHSPF